MWINLYLLALSILNSNLLVPTLQQSITMLERFLPETELQENELQESELQENELQENEVENSFFTSSDKKRLQELVILGEAVHFSSVPYPSNITANPDVTVALRHWPANEADEIYSVDDKTSIKVTDQTSIKVICQVRGEQAEGFMGLSEIWALVRTGNWQGYVPNSFVKAPQQQFVVSNCLQGFNPMATTITVKPAANISFVYNDKGTGAHTDIAVYRATLEADIGFYSLGDVAMSTYSPNPATIYVISAVDDELRSPLDYIQVWNDGGSGGKMDGSFWQPIAPEGYICLGNVAQNGYEKPSIDLIRCVKDTFVRPGITQLIWQDRGSGASLDVGVWEIIPPSGDPQGGNLNLFLSISNYDQPVNKNYVLDREAIQGGPFAHYLIDINTPSIFAPNIFLHPAEYYFPDSPSTFLENTHRDNGFLVTNEPLGCNSCTDPTFLDGLKPDTNKVPVYAEIVRRIEMEDDIVDFVYWTFYPYNNGKRVCVGFYTSLGCVGGYSTFGNHVGDWEYTLVRLVAGYVTKIYYSFHDSGLEMNWGEKTVGMTEISHFIAYAALGSHGYYPDATDYLYAHIPNGDTLVDYTGSGVEWKTWNTLVPFEWQTQGTYSEPLEFLNIRERWGNPESGCVNLAGRHFCVLDQGPTPPMSKDVADPYKDYSHDNFAWN